MVQITKAIWDALPKNEKRVHADKRKFVLVKRPGGGSSWQEVYWTN